MRQTYPQLSIMVLTIIASFGVSGTAFSQTGYGPIASPNDNALLWYAMYKYPAWYIFSPRGEKVGDAYSPDFRLNHFADQCLSDLQPPQYPIDTDNWSKTFRTDLKVLVELQGGLWNAEGTASAHLETRSSLAIEGEPAPYYRTVAFEDIVAASATSGSADNICEDYYDFITSISDGDYQDYRYFMLGELFYAKGKIESTQELVVEGQLTAEIKSAIADILGAFGISFRLEAEGSVSTLRSAEKPLRIDNPFAFNALLAREEEYDFVTALMVNTRLGGWLDREVYETTEIIDLLRENRRIRDYVYCYEARGIRGLNGKDIRAIEAGEERNCWEDTEDTEEKFIVINRERDRNFVEGRALLGTIYLHLQELGIKKEQLEG